MKSPVSDTIYLNLFTSEDGSGTDVGIRLADAMRYTAEEFADLYRRTVCAPPGRRAKRRQRMQRCSCTPKGNLQVKIAADVWTFPDEDSMCAAIERYGIKELPEKADA